MYLVRMELSALNLINFILSCLELVWKVISALVKLTVTMDMRDCVLGSNGLEYEEAKAADSSVIQEGGNIQPILSRVGAAAQTER